MKPPVFGLSGAVLVAALSLALPTFAQERGHQAGGGGDSGGARANTGGGGSTGTAVSRGDGGGAGGVYSGGSTSGAAVPSVSGGGGFSGGAVSGSGGSSYVSPIPSPMGASVRPSGSRPAAAARAMLRNEAAASPTDRAVPGGARPNYGRPATGAAVERPKTPSGGGAQGGTNVSYPGYVYGYPYYSYGSPYYSYGSPYYGSYGYMGSMFDSGLYGLYGYSYPFQTDFMYGYGAYGLGAFYYDPTWFGSAYAGGSGGGSSRYIQDSSSEGGPPKGGLKLKVNPSTAEVYVDGVRQGTVDEYNGAFQRLTLPAGAHHVDLRAPGYQALGFDVTIQPRDTIAYRGTMQSLQPVR